MRLLKENAILSKLNESESGYITETDPLKRLKNVYLMDRIIRSMNDESGLYDYGWLYEVEDEATDNGFEEFKKDAEEWDYANNKGKGTYYYTSDEDYPYLCRMYKEILDGCADSGFMTKDYYKNIDSAKASAGLDDEQLAFLKQDIPEPKLFGKAPVFEEVEESSGLDIINPEDKDYNDGRLYMVGIWSGSGYQLDTFYVYARYEEDALNQVVAYCEDNDPEILLTDEVVSELVEKDYVDEFKSYKTEIPNGDWFDFATSDLNFVYVDATMEGASRPYFIYGDNLVIKEVSEDEIKGMNESVKRKDPEEGFEIDDDLANSCSYMSYKGIKTRYLGDTNTLVFSYDNDKYRDEDDIDTIVYRNQTPEEIKKYIDTQLIPYIKNKDNLKESYFGVKDASYIDRGNWSDGAVRYRGFIYNAYEIQEALGDYFIQEMKDEGKEVPQDDSYWTAFDAWVKENPDKVASEVEGILYDYTPESIDPNLLAEVENEYSKDRLIKTLESWKERTDLPESEIDYWIKMAEEHCGGIEDDMEYESESVAEVVGDMVAYLSDKENIDKWFRITESVTMSEPENASEVKTKGKVRDYLNYELEDDDSEQGGISFNGETVEDFIVDTDISPDASLDELNKALVSCGIRPIISEAVTVYSNLDTDNMADEIRNHLNWYEKRGMGRNKEYIDKVLRSHYKDKWITKNEYDTLRKEYELDKIGPKVSEKELKGNPELSESDTGYDYWGPLSMERFDGPAYIQYYNGPGDLEYLVIDANGEYTWMDSSNPGEPEIFDTYEEALKVQKEVGGEIMSYKRDWLGESFKDKDVYEERLKESEEPEREWLKDKDTYNNYKNYVDKQLRDGAIDDPEYVNTLSDKEYDDLLTLTWMKDKDMLDMYEERLKESEEVGAGFNYSVDDEGVLSVYYGNQLISEISDCGGMTEEELSRLANEVYEESDFYNNMIKDSAHITNYSINGGEYAISICEKSVGGDCDFLVKAKDGKGNSSEIEGYDQLEGFEFTKEDEPFYSGGTISDEDIESLVHKFKPELEITSVERI